MLLLFVYIILYVPTNIVSTSLRLDGVFDLNKMVFMYDLARMDTKPQLRTYENKVIQPFKELAQTEIKSDDFSSNAPSYKHKQKGDRRKTEESGDSSAPFEDNTHESDDENLNKLIREVVIAKVGNDLSEPVIQSLISQTIKVLNNERDTSTYDRDKPTLRANELNNRLNGIITNLIASEKKKLAVKDIDSKKYRNEEIRNSAASVKYSVANKITEKVTKSGYWRVTPIHKQRKHMGPKSTTQKTTSTWPTSTDYSENGATNKKNKKSKQRHHPLRTKSNTIANFHEEKKIIPSQKQRKYKGRKSTTKNFTFTLPGSTDNGENAGTNKKGKKSTQRHHSLKMKSNTAKQIVKHEDTGADTGITQRAIDPEIPTNKDESTTKKTSNVTSSTITDLQKPEIDSDAENIERNSTDLTKQSVIKIESERENSKNSTNDLRDQSAGENIEKSTKGLRDQSAEMDSEGKNTKNSTTDLREQSAEMDPKRENIQNNTTDLSNETGIDSDGENTQNSKGDLLDQSGDKDSGGENSENSKADLRDQPAEIDPNGENTQNSKGDLLDQSADKDSEGENTQNSKGDLLDQSADKDSEEENSENSKADLRAQSAGENSKNSINILRDQSAGENSKNSTKDSRDQTEGENIKNSTKDLQDKIAGENSEKSTKGLRDQSAEMDPEGENTKNSTTDLREQSAEMDPKRENTQNNKIDLSNESGIDSEEENSENSKADLRDQSAEIDPNGENIQNSKGDLLHESADKDSEGENSENSKADLRDQSAEIDPNRENIQNSTTDLSNESGIDSEGKNIPHITPDLTLSLLKTTTNKYLFNSPRLVRDYAKIENFTEHVQRESIKMLNNIENQTATRWLKKQIAKVLADYKYEFLAFVKETMSNKIMTSLGTQRVILNTLDTSINILKNKTYRLMDLLEEKRVNGGLRVKQGFTTDLELRIDQLEDSHYKYACTLGICRSKDGFSKFLIDILTETLKSNDRKLRQATDTAIELLKNTDISKLADNATKAKIREYIQSVENLPIKTLRGGIETLKDILLHRNQPTVIRTEEDEEQKEASLFILEFMDKLEQTIKGINGSKVLLENLRQLFDNWVSERGKSDDIIKISKMLQEFLLDAILKMDDADRKTFKTKLEDLMINMKKKIPNAKGLQKVVPY